MADLMRDVDVYRTVQNGKRFTISLSENEAWKSLDNYWAYIDNPVDWTVERKRERVPVVHGEAFTTRSKLLNLTESSNFETVGYDLEVPHVGWDCPHCGQRHTTDLCDDLEAKSSSAKIPQLWFCERGRGIVIVEW